ncbi:MAG: ABC transporter substrate-binding protein [Candidatus Margulisiibacteriota bacterium]
MKKPFILVLMTVLLSLHGTAFALDYDGLWFMGFNLNKDVFGDGNGRLVRQAANYAIDRQHICTAIIGDNNTPTTVLPKGMQGHDDSLKGYPYNPAKAKALMKKAGYSMSDKRLKNIVLLHTDGDKTVEIVKSIKNYLVSIGIGLKLKQIDYEDQDSWDSALSGGKNHLFLMGYKAPDPYDSATSPSPDASGFLTDLFHSSGSANFFFLRDKKLDALIGQNMAKEVLLILQEDPVTVNLFYITKL